MTPPLPIDPEPVPCPHCGELLPIDAGGWAYRYTQALVHLSRCAADLPKEQRQSLATAVADNQGRRTVSDGGPPDA